MNEQTLIKSVYKYFGFILFGIIFYILKNKKSKKSDKANKANIETTGKKFSTELIHYQRSNASNFSIVGLIITCILYVLFLEFIEISYFYGLHDLDLWIFNILFALIFLSKYYSINHYLHHLISLGFIFFTNLVILIIKTFIDDEKDKNKENNENNENNGNNEKTENNVYSKVEKKFWQQILFNLDYFLIYFEFIINFIYKSINKSIYGD